MQIPFIVEFVDGNKEKVVTGTPDFIAFEERFIMQMQQGTIDYKNDGMNTLKYTLVDIEEITPKAKLINVIL